jgi:hypothetical protein
MRPPAHAPSSPACLGVTSKGSPPPLPAPWFQEELAPMALSTAESTTSCPS